MQHLYLHIPFCHRRCSYCDFNTYANLEDRIEAYVAALCAELALLPAPPAPPAERTADGVLTSATLRPTIFFGGGTPSMLTLPQLERILQAADRLVPVQQAEISLEANPGTLLGADTPALDYLRGLLSLGIRRLSLGVQTLHDPLLRVLGRTHTAAEAQQTYLAARRAGFENISLDVMFGLPGQTFADWQAVVDALIAWQPDHLSAYSLILEERTPLFAQVTSGRISVPDDDLTGAMYEHAIEQLALAGYQHYEISNWARASTQPELAPRVPAYACQHNLAYWLNSDYLAAGAGAHGHVYPHRYSDILNVDAYIQAVQQGQRPLAETIDLSHADLCAETMFMGLRLHAGVSRTHVAQRCGVDLDATYGDTLAQLAAQGLLVQDAHAVYLTARGRSLGNRVFEHFV